MITKEEIFEIVEDAFKEVCEINNISIREEVNMKTPLYGEKGYLDSLGLVNLIAAIEERLADKGWNITIVSEKAFSRRISPFLTIGTFVKFIKELITNLKR